MPGMCNVRFDLTPARVQRLANAGVNSLSGLVQVLAALDLRARIELAEIETPVLTPKPKEEETT